jgi:hypothetical protein
MAQLTRKGDKHPFNTSKSDYKSNAPVSSDATNIPAGKRIEGEGEGKGRAARRKSPYSGGK